MRTLTVEEFADLFATVRRRAFRLELQPVYREPHEADSVAAFLAGTPTDPFTIPGARWWFDLVSALIASGGRMERVRVQEDPPTDYQRWERWLDDEFSTPAGEIIRYMTRRRAHDIGLLPDAGKVDWWLLDDRHLIQMHFDNDGNRLRTELVEDPVAVAQAKSWWNLAVQHSAPLRWCSAA